MSRVTLITEPPEPDGAPPPGCHVCGMAVLGDLVPFAALDEDLRTVIEANALAKSVSQVCGRCIDLFRRATAQLKTHAAIFAQTDHVLPTPLRMDTDERFAGRDVTVAFLDSGFYAHPDLIRPQNRIVAYHSIFEAKDDPTSLQTTDVASWHGMMTSVVAAGNGYISNGFYRGIAPAANLVLVKIGRTGHIPEESIKKGLDWVLAHREEHRIRIINISAGGDWESSYLNNALCRTVEQAVRAGLVVVCAVGNAGMAPGHPVLPPACSPSAISVGGLDDQNSLDRARRGMYRSSYGPTIDGLQKPEIIAPGIWVAAPILPHTPTAAEAALYSRLDTAADTDLKSIIDSRLGVDKDLDEARDLPVPLLRQLVTIKLREGNVINPHYKHVDGTSFAAPIVSATAACMLEADPALSPQQVKRILIDTAERVATVEIDRQGWGVVSPRRALELALALRG
ncbi:MAG TPA: S8 family serine peptidase [Pyrinomonadaceae bacterium]|nr:S8 family serine peptidase [Pyrinomonadaceae bacterium]